MLTHQILMGFAVMTSLAVLEGGPATRSARSLLAGDPELREVSPPKPKPRVKAHRLRPRSEPVEVESDASSPAPIPSPRAIATPSATSAPLASPVPTVKGLLEHVRAGPRSQPPSRRASMIGRWSAHLNVPITITIDDQQPDGKFTGSFYCDSRFNGSVDGTVTQNQFRMLMHWSVLFVKGRRELNGAFQPSGAQIDHISGTWAGNAGLGMASGTFEMDRIVR